MPWRASSLGQVLKPFERWPFRRHLQETPILPDVWIAFFEARGKALDLLLIPRFESGVSGLVTALQKNLGELPYALRGEEGEDRYCELLGYNEASVLANLSFRGALIAALPLTAWWRDLVWRSPLPPQRTIVEVVNDLELLTETLMQDELPASADCCSEDQLEFIRFVGAVAWGERVREGETLPHLYSRQFWHHVAEEARGVILQMPPAQPGQKTPLYSINLNRPATRAIDRSHEAVKADAAVRLFAIRCTGLAWAVLDTGVDARHPVFGEVSADRSRYVHPMPLAASRIEKTYDFRILRELQRRALSGSTEAPAHLAGKEELFEELREDLSKGRPLNWAIVAPLLEVSHEEESYKVPRNPHGTHVAGILAANGEAAADPNLRRLIGVSPDLHLYDMRVLSDRGVGDEFTILSALQFIRYLNSSRGEPVIHGVNLSLSLKHEVSNYACGQTPICEECERLVNSGVVVVAAAGNRGYVAAEEATPAGEHYQSISITDPGNAACAITVGATHRFMPHTYGISFFSSRGPTGDGRCKPDLVAPGEKIVAPAPGGGVLTLDGTSMAAPHVSGAAALLMGRHRELIGRPHDIKKALCSTATDLGRERHFQGAGMLDVLRALQSV